MTSVHTEKEKFDEQESTVLIKHKCPKCSLELDQSVTVCPQDGTPVAEPLKPGIIFAEKYQLLDTIGTGGMGVIYKAKQLILDKTVAIKMVHAYIATPDNLRRFQQEGRAASGLSHPNIITVFDFGVSEQGDAFMDMDYCEGRTLSQVLKADGPLSLEKFYRVFMQVCDALGHAHSKGVLHRDIKPSNIMLLNETKDSEIVKILDFGIAKIIEPDNVGSDEHRERMQLTKTGEAIGSPLYMSPEQGLGQKVDQRSDQYSLGCVMYEALTGVPPFEGATVLDTMLKHLNDAPMPLKEVTLGKKFPDILQLVIFKLLAKMPGERYESMEDVARDLQSLQEASQSQKRLGRAELPAHILAQKEEEEKKKVARGVPYQAITYALSVALIGLLLFVGVNWSKLTRTDVDPKLIIEKENENLRESEKLRKAMERQIQQDPPEPSLAEKLKEIPTDEQGSWVDLQDQDLKAENLRQLQSKPVKFLNLNKSRFTDESLKELQPIKLEKIFLDQTAVSSAGLMNLTPIKTLQSLNLNDCRNLNVDALVKFHKALPGCLVMTTPANPYGVEMRNAMLAEQRGQQAEALAKYKNVIAALSQRPSEEDTINCLTYAYLGAGRAAFAAQHKEEAQSLFHQGCSRLDKIRYQSLSEPDQFLYAAALTQVIPYLNAAKDYQRAQDYAERALRIYQKLRPGDNGTLSGAWRTLGICLAIQTKYSQAADSFERELECYDAAKGMKDKSPEVYADALNRLGQCAMGTHNLPKAEKCYGEAVVLFEKCLKEKPVVWPQYFQCLQLLTITRSGEHKYAAAVESGRKCISFKNLPTQARGQMAYFLADSYAKLNMPAEATRYKKMSQELLPGK